jgi:hypothetical protein
MAASNSRKIFVNLAVRDTGGALTAKKCEDEGIRGGAGVRVEEEDACAGYGARPRR